LWYEKDHITHPVLRLAARIDAGGPIDGILELEEGKLRATLIKAVVKATLRTEKWLRALVCLESG
jgi:pyrroline-5-carboxylate reductase